MRLHPSRWRNVLLVACALLAATLTRAALTPLWGTRFPFVAYYPAVVFAAYLAGWTAGIVATVVSAAAIAILFLPHPLDRMEISALAFFLGANAVILLLAARLTRGREAAERAAIDARDREAQLRASEEEFRGLFETASIGHGQADPTTGRLLRVNKTLCDITGYTADELLGMTFHDLTHPDDREADRRGFERFVREGGPAYRVEKRYVRKDARVVWVKVEVSIVRDEAGRPVRTGATIEDVTAARAATAVLARSREELRAVLDAAPVAIWIAHDPECRMVTQNRLVDALLGPDGASLPCREPLRRAAASGEAVRDVEFTATRPDGRHVAFLGGAVPLQDPDGTVRGSVAACVDITDRSEAEEALRHHLELTRTITSNTPSMLVMADAQGRCTFVNEAASRMTGYAAEELIGHVLHDRIHHRRPDGTPYPLANCPTHVALGRGEIVSGHEDVFVRKDGTFFPVRCAARPIFRADELVGTVLEVQDATQEKHAAEALREREHELRLALKAGRMASVVWDMAAGTATWSEEYFGLLGLPPGAITPTYEAWRALVHPDDIARVEDEVRRATGERHDLVVEYRNVWDDGTIKWVEGRGHFDYDAEGRPVRMLGILMDVDHRKAAEQARERAATAMRRIQRISDAMLPDLGLDALLHEVLTRVVKALETDTATIVLRGPNDHDEQMSVVAPGIGHDRREDIRVPRGAGFAGILVAERRPIVWDEIDPARLASPLLQRVGVRTLAGVPLMSGDELLGVILVGSVRPRRFGAEELHLLRLAADRIALGIERTARRDAERRARDAAEEANRAKDRFLAMLGHELRNPIAAIRNAVVTAHLDAADSERALGIVRRQSKHLGRLVDDLLDVARVAQGKIALRRGRVDLRAVAEHALEATRTLIAKRGHAVSVLLANDVHVDGDAQRLEQIVGNLLANAARYTEPGGRITLALDRDGAEAVVRVRDTGIGIAADALPSVFDLFVQAERSPEREAGGLGVGLTIAKRLVELHGGRIEARSEGPGKGSEFVVRLPALPPAVSQRVPPATAAPTPSRRVLLVEDNVDVAEALGMLLRRIGADVEIVRDGPRAIAAARAAMPDLALIDIGLPKMDGYQVAARIRALPGGRDAVLVALTGYGSVEDRERALRAGFDAHQTKPVELGALRALLRRLGRPDDASRTSTLH